MSTWLMKRWHAAIGATALVCMQGALCSAQAPPPISSHRDLPTTGTESSTTSTPVSLEIARDRARLMSEIYLATLDVMHDRYFHSERAILPARAMEDVFAEIRRQSKMEARWISVSLKPMSITHEPKTDFEKKAAKEIDHGKTEFESVEGGVFRRATAVPLVSNCINCHAGNFNEPTKSPKFAGLVISIPVVGTESKP